ncbi:uncharacterized protein [Montipora capricornis]|uniref:uncharacterized protein n=1 Tax=Montipora capricornis TaxID=246305 RepID=UPI0035F15A8D
MSHLNYVVVVILLHCVLAGLALQHEEHHHHGKATRKWTRRPKKRPSLSPRPRKPSLFPSTSTGGEGGDLMGSGFDSNVLQSDSDFEQEALNAHNKYRKVHGVPEMTLDRALSNQAKAYAQKIANMGQLVHSSQAERGQSVGENLAYACSSNGVPLTGESTTKMWYDEVCKPGYDFNNGGFSGGTAHFTQVVWKESVKLGIGRGKSTQNGMQCIYAVGRYEVAGNMVGEFQDNVLKGNFDQQYCNNICLSSIIQALIAVIEFSMAFIASFCAVDESGLNDRYSCVSSAYACACGRFNCVNGFVPFIERKTTFSWLQNSTFLKLVLRANWNRKMNPLNYVVVVILSHCVLAGLALSHKEHHRHGKGRHHKGRHQVSYDLQSHHKVQAKHKSLKHGTTVGAQRGNVPSPLQDFVLVSGNPLFHERPRNSDTKTNATEESTTKAMEEKTPPQIDWGAPSVFRKPEGQSPLASHKEEANEQPKQEENRPSDSKNTTATVASELQLIHGNGTASQEINPFKYPEQNIKAGMNQEKNKENHELGNVTSQTPKNTSSEAISSVSLSNSWKNPNTETNPTTWGSDNYFVKLKQNLLSTDWTKAAKAASGALLPKTNKTMNATDEKPEAQKQNEGGEHFPFNIPGVRNYGKEKTENEGAKLGKHLTENLGPNCHWKITKGNNGENVTSLSCSGEFTKPEEQRFAFEKTDKNEPLTNVSGSKETSSENFLLPKTGGEQKESHEESDEEFEKEAVATVNEFRKIHRAFDITLSPELSRQAREYAKKIANMGSLQHDLEAVKELDEGENLAMGCKQFGVPLTAREAITNWYNEVCDYDFDRAEFSMSTGHFTQVVWADSKEFGIGKAAGKQNGMPCTFVVGRFTPSGNYKGEYKKNVFKGKFDRSYCDKLKYKKLL